MNGEERRGYRSVGRRPTETHLVSMLREIVRACISSSSGSQEFRCFPRVCLFRTESGSRLLDRSRVDGWFSAMRGALDDKGRMLALDEKNGAIWSCLVGLPYKGRHR